MTFQTKHDLHCHTFASVCSHDEGLTPEYIVRQAEALGFDTVCMTDHYWDAAAGPCSAFYAPQDFPHLCEKLPLPQSESVRVLFGCETEFSADGRLGITPETIDKFDFIIIPPNHFHQEFVRGETPLELGTMQELFFDHMDRILAQELPWERVGIAHLNCAHLFPRHDVNEMLAALDEKRLHGIFSRLARCGCGVELNVSTFPENWREHEDAQLRLFRIALEEGCRFYCGSDTHKRDDRMARIPVLLQEVADALGLRESDRYTVPAR